jgi:hypothetical protein
MQEKCVKEAANEMSVLSQFRNSVPSLLARYLCLICQYDEWRRQLCSYTSHNQTHVWIKLTEGVAVKSLSFFRA